MSQQKLFHICTISNDAAQYEKMKTSFLKAGFHQDDCTYTLYDNTVENRFDPYQTFNAIQNQFEERYIIFCHQDVVLDQGDNFTDLVEQLNVLESKDPSWAICGNAGVNYKYQYVVRISDPNNSPNWRGNFPQRVLSLDENFLVIKSAKKIKCSNALSGFHFYGSDLCLQAISRGYSCYVINFHLSHFSGGTLNDSFWEIKSAFYSHWSARFTFCYIKTLTGQFMCFSKINFYRVLGSVKVVRKVLLLINRLRPFLFPN